ncbi:MarR family winged helix-turn-helix transcriptional regulator [Glutamicibacter protophormiae]|uniref:DNA-binding MarR family transcriptional regulator n=1 Tax=Glutamicibacter protophormiae TaxID=37930 RepID=A0ABS4XNP3_GLUPR|nr:MarR family transcriptional regulator [Glutamicibacter protophormiae]MBP2398114.1 DNA-binding MarR family transcriptional regulator [Glutamicibacter protophormiae]GGL99598.1 transcriptional regulator [Glutamicibacter protophormiae]
MGTQDRPQTSEQELAAFETATQDLVGLALSSVEQLEVSLPQFRLLLTLQRRGRSTSSDCAKALGVGNSSITRLADRLHASGHLARGSDPAHRSVVTLELTAAGRQVVQQVTERRRQDLKAALDLLEPAERAACAAALDKLHHVAGRSIPRPNSTHLPL